MTIFALYSIKGGVGKTAAAVNLAHEAARAVAPVLLCDLDPQGAASFYFRVRAAEGFSKRRFLKGGKHIDRNIRGTDFENLDLLPSTLSFRNLDLALDHKGIGKNHLKRLIAPLAQEYEHVFVDCPPSVTLLAEHVFRAVDYVLVPCIPTTLSMLTLEKLAGFFDKHDVDRRKLVPFFSMVEKRKTLHRNTMEEALGSDMGFLEASIPYSSDVERMGLMRRPVACFRSGSPAVHAYRALWRGISERRARSGEPAA